MTRRTYLDWLRGIAVLIMIEAHTLDSWTVVDDRSSAAYRWAIVIGGFGAPIFLFLAGVALALASGKQLRATASPEKAAARMYVRGWQIFGLAFLFRLQSWVISGGPPSQTILKVDILNIMGIAMLMAALVWSAAKTRRWRAIALACTAIIIAMLTPIVRTSPLLDALPDQVEWYFRPYPGRTTFTIFPWAGFLLAGAAIGMWLDAARTDEEERRTLTGLALLGPALALGGYGTSLLPPLYRETSFWTSSPTFFFLRLGILISAVPLAYLWNARVRGRSPLRDLGVSSLFVYWIHVEMVYGVVSIPIHRRLSFPQAVVAFVAFSTFIYWLVKLKERYTSEPSKGHHVGHLRNNRAVQQVP